MQTRTLFVFGVLIAVVVVVSAGGGKGGKGWMEKMKKCGDGEMVVEEAMKGMKECKDEGKTAESRRRRSPDGEEGGKKGKGKWGKNMCAKVCAWKKQGVLDDNGKFSETGAQDFVNKAYPEKYRTDAYNSLKACADESSSTFSMDDNCSSYKKFKMCSFKGHMKTCGIEWGKGKDKGGDKPEPAEGGDEE